MGLTTFLNDRPPTRGLSWLALSDTGFVLSSTVVSDSGGGGSVAWNPSGTVSCRVDPLSASSSRLTGGAIDERSTHVVTTPNDTSVDVRDRISISGRGTFEVTAVRSRTGQLTQVFEVLHLQ